MEIKVLVDNLTTMASATIKPEKGDYVGHDGLWYCGKCHTQKQWRGEMMGEVRTMPAACKCRQAVIADRKAAELKAHAIEKCNELRWEAFPEAEMHKWRFENDDQFHNHISVALRRYADNFEERKTKKLNGFMLYGPVGTGKTFWAVCVGHALLDQGITVMFTSFDRIRNRILSNYDGREKYLESLNNVDLLIIDDLGAESTTEYMQELVFSVITARANAHKPMIVTTNLTKKQLSTPRNIHVHRVYSRMLGMCQPIEVKGEDRRLTGLREESAELKAFLKLED